MSGAWSSSMAAALVAGGVFGGRSPWGLEAMAGGGAFRSGGVGNPVLAFREALRPGEEDKALARLGREPAQARAMEQFRRAADRATDPAAALRDPRILNVVTRALGIPEGAQQAGLAVRALLENPSAQGSLVNRLPDGRWKAANEALGLHARGSAALRDPQVQARLAEGLARAARYDEMEARSPGVGDAMLFVERAAQARGSAFAVLGDPVLRRVALGAVGLPREIVVQSVEAQARALESRLDLKKLGNPREVERLAERFLLSQQGAPFGGVPATRSGWFF